MRKAIATGRITPEPDGTIDAVKADAEWARNTSQAYRGSDRPAAAQAAPVASSPRVMQVAPRVPARARLDADEVPAGGTATFTQARTANEVLKAQHHKVRLARLKGELIERAQALAHVFALARAERDAWLNWPARISSLLAAEFGADPHAVHVALEREVRSHLAELGDVRIRLDA